MSAQSERLKRRLQAIPRAAVAAVTPALIKAANEMADTMRQLAPEDTGALRDSIAVTPPGQSTPPYSQPGGSAVAPSNAVLITAGNTEVRYPHLVEHGTAEAPAQPFFWPAFRLHRKKAASGIKRAVAKAVRSTKT
ncbi:HK97 gp10 family phage protein [Ancylobacter sp. WKF20]|uniref:HK97-gp10 family putative phage morphogenesis protein n=1 Tax=Ancylobacter sp. WKF20 TaxID=3039801 RepID=UPI0024343464|nr:HK97-gp10 family putative phage morphogenesis protein [Ancylobacter sp. WKF20]WGD32015.1 HK97 gp10 family phage protein [Ancylobacter sp. WKF20]